MPISLPTARRTSTVPNLAQPLSSQAQVLKAAGGEFRVERLILEGGRRDGVEVLLVDTGRVRAALLITRGLSLWRANIDGLDCGWKSPVDGPIHPQWVPLSEPGGLGWLDGFDELLVRCGLRSFGAPDFDAKSGRLLWPLHGRIGNLPTENLEIELDSAHSLLMIKGQVSEQRFLQNNLQLFAQYTFSLNSNVIEVHDRVLNGSDVPGAMQLLYHINVGAPLLGAGAKLHLPADRIVARDAHAAEDIKDWATYRGPTAGYVEQVYFSSPKAIDGWVPSLLTTADSSKGFAVHYKPETLPYFSQWKNTVGERDGYVTGLEPGTGFPNPRSFEDTNGRVVQLAPGESKEFHLKLEGIASAERVKQLSSRIATANGTSTQTVAMDTKWCVPRN